MTPEQLAALRAGKSMEEVLAMATSDATDKTSDTEAVALAAAAAKTNEGNSVFDAQLAEANTKLEAATAQLTEKDAALAASVAEVEGLKASNTKMQAELSSVAAVLSAQVKPLAAALNASVDTTKMSASEIVAKHAELSAQVREAYKSGRNSASTTGNTKPADASASAILAAATSFKL